MQDWRAMPNITIKYFASIADRMGKAEEIREVPQGCTPACLLGTLGHERPELKEALAACRVAVNLSFADDAQELAENDEVALIPPVSGG